MKRRHLGVALVAMGFLSQAMLSGFDDRACAGQAGALSVGGTLSDVDYSLDVRMLTVPLTLDWYPFADAFHLSAGIIVNQTKMDLNVRSSAMFDNGSMIYSVLRWANCEAMQPAIRSLPIWVSAGAMPSAGRNAGASSPMSAWLSSADPTFPSMPPTRRPRRTCRKSKTVFARTRAASGSTP